MNEMQLVKRWPKKYDQRYQFSEDVGEGVSQPLRIPGVGKPVGVCLSPEEGVSAKVEYTFSSYSEVESGTAVWVEWPLGNVEQDTTDISSPAVSALRVVSDGQCKWSVSI